MDLLKSHFIATIIKSVSITNTISNSSNSVVQISSLYKINEEPISIIVVKHLRYKKNQLNFVYFLL